MFSAHSSSSAIILRVAEHACNSDTVANNINLSSTYNVTP